MSENTINRRALVREKKLTKNEIIEKSISILTISGVVLTIALTYLAYKNGLMTSEAKLKEFLDNMGNSAPIGFLVIQIIQTIIPIIPGSLTCPAGAMIFGTANGFIINFIGIMIGSVANFFLARKYGRQLVKAVVSKKQYDKYIRWLTDDKGFDRLFTFGMFFPISPADLLCWFAGISNLSFKKFFLILIAGKPITLFLYTYGLTEILKFFGKFIIG
ncbi:MAG: TVP38/TMEM64 family protein [Tissierellia bacterium]|nr:TVP38/TMEM64 family protein [Tissierellia bacterium]